jgi:secreted trypsin-like serine protease
MSDDDALRRILRAGGTPRAPSAPESADDRLRPILGGDRLVFRGKQDVAGAFSACVAVLDGAEAVGSGVLIAPRWALTAAHNFAVPSSDGQRCWLRPEWQRARIAVVDADATREAPIESVVLHPAYDPAPTDVLRGARSKNDVALVRLARDLSGPTAPIARDLPRHDAVVTIVGYGGDDLTADRGRGVRRFAELLLGPGDLDAPAPAQVALGYHPPEEIVLGYRPNVDRSEQPDTRRGDSGGPVLARGAVIAIACRAARRDEDGRERSCGVYASVPAFVPWIQAECDSSLLEVV